MTRPIRGSTEGCLVHFSNTRQQQLNENRCRVRNKICALLDIGDAAGHYWFVKKIMPSGVNLFKLQLLLELVGYTVIEREPLSALQRETANQLALLVVSTKDAAEYTGVTENTVLRWATNRSTPLEEKEAALSELLDLHRSEAGEKLKHWQSKLQELQLVSTQPIRSSTQVVSVPKHETNGSLHGQMIDMLAHLILAAKPLAEQILSDEYTPEEREQLRQKTQVVRANGVFDLSNLLNRLCSERARKEINH